MPIFHLTSEETETQRNESTCFKFHSVGRSGMRALISLLLLTHQFHEKKAASYLPQALPEFTEVHPRTPLIRATGNHGELLDWLKMQHEGQKSIIWFCSVSLLPSFKSLSRRPKDTIS